MTMSSREIADLCEKRHPDVRRDIKAMVSGLGDDVSRFAHTYKDAAGRDQEEYHLPKDLTLTLVAGYNVVLRKRSRVPARSWIFPNGCERRPGNVTEFAAAVGNNPTESWNISN